jgi:hypothetical protein
MQKALVPTSSRPVAEYLSVLDDAAFSGATPVEPKVISPTDPAARYTASANSVAGYAYSDNYLIDLKHAVIGDVEATTTIRQAEVGAAKTMLDRTAKQFDLTPSRLVADGGYGSADMVGWLNVAPSTACLQDMQDARDDRAVVDARLARPAPRKARAQRLLGLIRQPEHRPHDRPQRLKSGANI